MKKFSKVDLSKTVDFIQFMTDVLKNVCEASGYSTNCIKSFEIFKDWYQHKAENMLAFRDKQFRSVHTGKLTPHHHTPWIDAFDDTLESFGLEPFSSK